MSVSIWGRIHRFVPRSRFTGSGNFPDFRHRQIVESPTSINQAIAGDDRAVPL